MDKNMCCADVYRGSWSRRSSCTRTASIYVDGKWYCKTHDPVSKEKREKENDEKWNSERKAKEEKASRICLMESFFKDVPTEKITGHFYDIKDK